MAEISEGNIIRASDKTYIGFYLKIVAKQCFVLQHLALNYTGMANLGCEFKTRFASIIKKKSSKIFILKILINQISILERNAGKYPTHYEIL